MTPYHNPASGIDAYEYDDNSIRIRFKGGTVYEYRSPPIASHHINTMKQHADSKDDLNTYINTHRDEVYSKARKLS